MTNQLGIPESSPGGPFARAKASAPSESSSVSVLDRWVVKLLIAATPDIPVTLALWNGEVVQPRNGEPKSGLVFRNRRALYSLVRNPGMNFGDLYCTGDIKIEGELRDFLRLVRPPRNARPSALAGLWRRLAWRNTLPKSASTDAARSNIHHHYDVGNDFYALWLDRHAMQYTCAYYPNSDLSLEEAQTAKMHHVCRKLQLQPGQTVVEAGCGWGGFARFMAREYGVRVRAYNISREQVAHATACARADGLSDLVEFVEDDYRNIAGQYDVFVSIGMLEHVGLANYSALGELIARSLREDGLGLIHSIGRNHPMRINPWIEKRIFPGAYPPTLMEMSEIFQAGDLSVLDVENIRLHYAKTLDHWLERFEANAAAIRETYDEAFLRAFRLYMTGSMTSFLNGDLQLFQLVIAPAGNNELSWSRAHIYQQDHP